MALSCLLRGCSSKLQGLTSASYSTKVLKLSSVTTTSRCYNQLLSDKTRQQDPLYSTVKTQVNFPTGLYNIAKNFSVSQVHRAAQGSDHVKIWTIERVLSASLVPLLPAMFLVSNQALETTVAVVTVMHLFWGLEAIVVDYIRPIIFGPTIPKIGIALVFLFSIAVLAGMLNLIYNDCGLANAVREIWKL